MDQNAKQQVVEKLKNASNVLVTVSSNPSVDDLAAAIGLSLLLGKLNKHATAVFSGAIPPAIEFLQPGKQFDKDVAGLRDFIIALDKDKADKLRYKVEDNVVRIFITPYKTTLTKDDLRFEEGDFNVDAVVALGVSKREDLDGAIKAHGRILHDAAVLTVNAGADTSSLGAIDWQDPSAGSLCEMLVSITESFGSGLLDEQMSTAFLTGIVAETERFSNTKTSPKVMTMAAQLMAAGANQQLIASNLELPENPATPAPPVTPDTPEAPPDLPPPPAEDDSQLTIKHDEANQTPPVQNQPPAALPPMAPPAGSAEGTGQLPPAIVASPPLPAPPPPPPQLPTPNQPDQSTPPEASQPPHDKTLRQLETEISDLAGGAASKEPPVNQSNVLPPDPIRTKPIMDSFNLPPPPTSNEPEDMPAIDNRISGSKGRGPRDFDADPAMGGTFNATSQQAHDENVSDLRKNINATLLSHPAQKALDANEAPPVERPDGRAKDLQPLDPNLANPGPASTEPASQPSAVSSPPPIPETGPPSPPTAAPPPNDIEAARRAVEEAVNNQPFDPSHNPTQAVGSMPIQQDQVAGPAVPAEISIDNSGNLRVPGAQVSSQPPPANQGQDFQLPTPPGS